jgi:hypothetical protein
MCSGKISIASTHTTWKLVEKWQNLYFIGYDMTAMSTKVVALIPFGAD